MIKKVNCKICGKEFDSVKYTNVFCQRKCFKRDYYLRKHPGAKGNVGYVKKESKETKKKTLMKSLKDLINTII